jgi:hypothetical protein
LQLNAQWYSDFKRRKGVKAERLGEAKAVIRLGGSGLEDVDLIRVFRVLMPEDDGTDGVSANLTLRGFLFTCRLSETYWGAVLSRTRREDPMVGTYMWHKAAQVYLREGVPMENDSHGGIDPALGEYKRKFCSRLVTPCQLRHE